ncbi:hypothetical protein GCM10010298_37500 [Streptomyces microflavus]|uniref:Uncharacterized protein n=1 Tax=Streptomyces microflavus TaxID=1919 RepID=A0A7J0D1P9_STRMI|nr:hypothetical protein Smic_64930 [Streptomyces microflavus]GGX69383.1 hypothetical protein GCM10010298_37500 [Streptomyces microflavus]
MSGTDTARDSIAQAIGRSGGSKGPPRALDRSGRAAASTAGPPAISSAGPCADVCTDVMRPPFSEPLNTLTNQPT